MVLPLRFPAVVAGSIFTFSLSLGDYVAVEIVGGTSSSSAIWSTTTSARPTTSRSPRPSRLVPVLVMIVYLFLSRRVGALENL